MSRHSLLARLVGACCIANTNPTRMSPQVCSQRQRGAKAVTFAPWESLSSHSHQDSLWTLTPRPEQRAGEEGVLPVHLPVSVEIQPPAPAYVTPVTRAELCLQPNGATHL